MNGRSRRPKVLRKGIRALPVVALCAAAVAAASTYPATAATVAPNSTTSSSDLVGTWNITVQPSGGTTQYGTITFNSDHSLKLVGQNNSFTGTGLWEGGSSSWFSFEVLHPLPGTSDEINGLLWGQDSGGAFSTSGHSQVYGTSYNPLSSPSSVTVTGTKVS